MLERGGESRCGGNLLYETSVEDILRQRGVHEHGAAADAPMAQMNT